MPAMSFVQGMTANDLIELFGRLGIPIYGQVMAEIKELTSRSYGRLRKLSWP